MLELLPGLFFTVIPTFQWRVDVLIEVDGAFLLHPISRDGHLASNNYKI